MSYTVVGLLGRGGMAVVELATDSAGRHVARKRVSLHGSAREIDLARQRIRREAEILGGLRHRGIVPLLDVEDDGADLVLVMPRMASSLADRVATDGPLNPFEVADIGRILLDALATAHRQGVVHRDIKPANILFDISGSAALADFGVAIARHFTPGLTAAGMVIGTPGFVAPEQARGEAASPASDVFALGATLAFALTGRGPYGDGDPHVLMVRAARGQVAPLPKTVPNGLRRPLQAMLDPRPGRRPTAAGALGGPSGTQLQPAPPTRRRWRLRTKLACWLTAAIIVAAAAAGLVMTGMGREVGVPAPVHLPPVTTAPCIPLAYQPCGQPAAPNTDGTSCLAGYADFDGVSANGCEAHSDYAGETVLSSRQPVAANLVPAGATDTFRTEVSDSPWDLCLGKIHVTLTAPAGVSDRVQVLRGGRVLASAVSVDGRPAVATAGEPSCFHDNSGWLTIVVSSVSGQSAADFGLSRSGSW